MTAIDVDIFTQEKECSFKGERYSVRDNGAVFRHQPNGKRTRTNDNLWTFGKEDPANAYLHIANVRVHRIVATAFHGEPPDPKYVVDHIDSNRQNNRPENLRWLSRLENTLKNPATRKKIEYLCGSIEAFLENPSMLNELQGDPNFSWMRTVTPEEAQNCMTRMSVWANTDNESAKSINASNGKSSFGDRVYQPLQKWEVFGREPGLEMALTPMCAQYMWRAEAYFPCCPKPNEFGQDRLDDYFQNLKAGTVLAYSDNSDFCPKLIVLKSIILNESSIVVLSERADGKWSTVGIEFDKKSNHFIHFILCLYSSKDDAEQAFIKREFKDFWDEAIDNVSNL